MVVFSPPLEAEFLAGAVTDLILQSSLGQSDKKVECLPFFLKFIYL